jgi:hypothetical protein
VVGARSVDPQEIVGKKFNRITVVEFSHVNKWLYMYRCLCDCGRETMASRCKLIGLAVKQCRACANESKRSRIQGWSGLRCVYRSYKYAAKQRGYEFSLSIEEFREIATQNCFYCGSLPMMRTGANSTTRYTPDGEAHSLFTHNGIDRYDNTKGYTLENSVPCCTHCNVAKASMTIDQFKELVTRIYQRIVL